MIDWNGKFVGAPVISGACAVIGGSPWSSAPMSRPGMFAVIAPVN